MKRSAWTFLPLVALVLPMLACGTPPEPAGWDEAPVSGYGALFEGAPANDSLPSEMKADYPYPAKSSELVAENSAVKSQGSRGVCSIFSTTALMEHLYIKAGYPKSIDFSEQWLQWSAKFQVKAFTSTSGSNAAKNLEAISRFGIPREAAWPYETYQWSESNDPECVGKGEGLPARCYTNGEPSDEQKASAELFKLPTGRYLNTNSIKHHMHFEKTAVVVGVDFFYQAWNHRKSVLPTTSTNWNKGIVLAPNADDVEESHKMRAGHSILLVGWDEELEVETRDKEGNVVVDDDGKPVTEKGFFIFKNSWGTSGFGIDNPFGAGYGYISQKYIDRYGSARVSKLPEPLKPDPIEEKEKRFAGNVTHAQSVFHSVTLPETAKNIVVEMTGDGDADLYTRFGDKPTEKEYDCRPYKSGSKEQCTHASATAATLELMVYGWDQGTSTYDIIVRWE